MSLWIFPSSTNQKKLGNSRIENYANSLGKDSRGRETAAVWMENHNGETSDQ